MEYLLYLNYKLDNSIENINIIKIRDYITNYKFDN